MLADEDEPERDDRQVVAAQAQRERADHRADQRTDQHRAREPERERQVQLAADLRGGVRARADEERVAERDLPGVAREQVEADRADRRDAGVVQDAQPEVVGDERRQQQVDAEPERQPCLRPAAAEEAQVILVAARHAHVRARHQTRLTSGVPNSPCGRTSRIAIITK